MTYELIQLDTFVKSLESYPEWDRKKLLGKVKSMLSLSPYRYGQLEGPTEINGVKFIGLHKMKSGLSGRKGGAYILYRICDECKKNGYNLSGKTACEFCDDKKDKHVVLFISKPRGLDY